MSGFGWSRMGRAAMVVTMVLMLAGVLPLPAGRVSLPGGPNVPSAAAAFCASPGEIEVLRLVNQRRAEFGLEPVVLSAGLSAAAEFHSADMGLNDYFDHTLSDGTPWSQNIRNHGYDQDTWRGENIAAGNSDPYLTFMQWVNSPGHDANMRSPSFVAIGIGHVETPGSTWTNYWTQTFGGYVDTLAMGCDGSDPSAAWRETSGKTATTQLRPIATRRSPE